MQHFFSHAIDMISIHNDITFIVGLLCLSVVTSRWYAANGEAESLQ